MEILWAILLIIALIVCWLLTIIGVPGNWLMILAAAFYVYFGPESDPLRMHWGWLLGLIFLASIGELFEFLASALGAAKLGGSKRGASLAFVGSIAGGIAGLFIGVPIPVLGQVIAALIGACLGAFLGAMLGEKWKGRDWPETLKISTAAGVGRLLGTIGKVSLGFVMILAACTAIFF
jgi:uncharacterized protein YqgC (DUF456 family)